MSLGQIKILRLRKCISSNKMEVMGSHTEEEEEEEEEEEIKR
jgi:hypothetical protein